MPNKAIPESQKTHNVAKEKDDLHNEGVALYLAELTNPKKEWLASRGIAAMLEKRHFEETGHQVKLCHNTILEHSKGRRSQVEYASDQEILHAEERRVVIDYLIQCAEQGFPLTHVWLKEVVDDILRARLGEGFPGVGMNYTHRFLEKASDEIKVT
jgi:hypothetical protein